MKENKLTIQINKPLAEVFAFTIDPKNTPKWIDDSEKEETSRWPVGAGTVYTNTGKNGVVLTFKMLEFVPNDHFLMLGDDGYHCRYTYRDLGDNTTELEYHEWMDSAELEFPFTQEILQKLKKVIES